MVDITVNRHSTRPTDITCVQRDFFYLIILYNTETNNYIYVFFSHGKHIILLWVIMLYYDFQNTVLSFKASPCLKNNSLIVPISGYFMQCYILFCFKWNAYSGQKIHYFSNSIYYILFRMCHHVVKYECITLKYAFLCIVFKSGIKWNRRNCLVKVLVIYIYKYEACILCTIHKM